MNIDPDPVEGVSENGTSLPLKNGEHRRRARQIPAPKWAVRIERQKMRRQHSKERTVIRNLLLTTIAAVAVTLVFALSVSGTYSPLIKPHDPMVSAAQLGHDH